MAAPLHLQPHLHRSTTAPTSLDHHAAATAAATGPRFTPNASHHRPRPPRRGGRRSVDMDNQSAAAGGNESALEAPSQLVPTASGNDYVEITLDVRLTTTGGTVAAGGRDDSQVGDPQDDLLKVEAVHKLTGLSFVSGIRTSRDDAARRFDQLAVDGCLRRSKFGKCIGLHGSDEFAVQLFDALAWRRNISRSWISKAELLDFWDQISSPNFDTRLQTFFDMMDKNAVGRITEEQVRKMIALSASANKLPKVEEQASEYARLIMEELDPGNLGYIELYNLEMLLLQAPSQSARKGTTDDLSRMPSLILRPTLETNRLRRWYRRSQHFLEDHWRRLWVLLLWLSVCAALFAWKFVQYRRRYVFEVMGYCVCVAKGGAETLKFNMALILLPVCRNTITWIRNFAFVTHVVLPINDSINFHEVIAVGIAIGTGLHVVSHMACTFPRLLHATDTGYAPLARYFGTERDWRPPDYWWFLKDTGGWTGLAMLLLTAMAFTLALPRFRRGRVRLPSPLNRLTGFNAFWYSHHLLVIVYALLIVHGHFLYLTHEWYNKSTWMYLAVPMLIYAGERLARALRSSMLPVKILKVVVYPGNTLSLHFSKPPGFQYKSGQYIFLNCPTISPLEWHPFCITSAPEDNYVSVHIRTLGDWTCRLKIIFSEVCRPPTDGKSGLLRAEYDHDRNTTPHKSLPKVLINGPYGLMAQDYRKYETVFLIGIGIGATPMISILKDSINNMKQLHGDLESGNANNNSMSSSSFRTRRIYFYWVTRDQGSSEWFRSVMDEVAEIDKMGVIEFHTYFTSIYEEHDVRTALIGVLQSLNYAKNGVDIVSGTRVKTHFARPNWREVYKSITLNHHGQRVGVFYCGAPVLVKELRELARDFSRKTTTKFEFYNEVF